MFQKGSKTCSGEVRVPEAATGGTWQFRISGFYTGTKYLPLAVKDVPFRVIAAQHLIVPTAATVQINPSQVQLFRTEASRLQVRVQTFKLAVAEATSIGSPAAFAKTASTNIEDAIGALDKTRETFRGYASTAEQEERGEVFFADLRKSYVDMKASLNKSSMHPINYQRDAQPHTMEMPQKQAPYRYDLATEAALRPFEQNELAYTIVADTQSLTFDLVVKSNPPGATVCYHRRGDSCHENPDGTNTTITGLTYAIWLVKFDKAGYKPQEIEHDPFREPNHVIEVELGH